MNTNMPKKVWYLPSEVAVHNRYNDIWVTLHGRVLDLTALVACFVVDPKKPCNIEECGKCGVCACNVLDPVRLIVAFAGKDISHWFKPDQTDTFELKTHIHHITTQRCLYSPHGRWLDHSIIPPSVKWRPAQKVCWYNNPKYVIGRVTQNPRPIKVTNSLSVNSSIIEVCEEETIDEIMQFRYQLHNSNYKNYVWSYMRKKLCPNKTLTENGIPDLREKFLDLALPEDVHIPNILLHYIDPMSKERPLNMGYEHIYDIDCYY